MTLISIFIFILVIALPVYFIAKSSAEKKYKRDFYQHNFPSDWIEILKEKVAYYNGLTKEDQLLFQKKLGLFLSEANIAGVGVEIDDTLRLLIASSAVIPVFRFEGWTYINMGEILVYDGEVHTGDPHTAKDGILLGQVRPFQTSHLVLFSKQSLEQGFQFMKDGSNVGIHEFAHMIDQADGSIDGIPNAVMPEALLKPWTKLMYAELEKMKKGQSDINPYGLTNHAEFFAVVCEYFFENPHRFKKHHPELYEILFKTFRQG